MTEIEDLSSSNGTMLNGRRVSRRVLRDGDELRIGTSVVIFRDGPVGVVSEPASVEPPRSEVVPAAPVVPASETSGGDKADDVDLFGEEDDLFDGAADEELPAPPPGVTRVTLPPLDKSPDESAPIGQSEPARPASAPPAAVPPASPRASAPPPSAPPAAVPPASPRASAPPPSAPPAAVPPASPRASAPPPAADRMVEFADEVVELRSSRPPTGSSTPAAAPAENAEMQQQSRILQFAKTAKPGGKLADDIGQMNVGARWLVYAFAGAGTVGLIWGVMQLVG